MTLYCNHCTSLLIFHASGSTSANDPISSCLSGSVVYWVSTLKWMVKVNQLVWILAMSNLVACGCLEWMTCSCMETELLSSLACILSKYFECHFEPWWLPFVVICLMPKQRNYQMLHFRAYEGQASLKLDLQYVIHSPLVMSHKDDVWSPFVSQHWMRFRVCLDQTD